MKHSSRKVWINGEILPESEARISIYDSAFQFGDTIFEMSRSFNGVQFKLREHLERLLRSARYVHIPMSMGIDELTRACDEVQAANQFEPDDEHRLMINVTRGLLGIYGDVSGGHVGTNVIISDFPLRWTTAGMGKLFDTGINAVTPSQRAIPAHLLDPKVKNRSRLHYQMANIEVSRYRGDNNWALLLDEDGFVTEGTGANFFIVKDSVIKTPEPRNILRGISRDRIFELYPVEETNIEPYDVYNADESFFTGTPFCILPVTKYNGVEIGDGDPGCWFRKLVDVFCNGIDIKAQIQAWDEGAKEGVSPYEFNERSNHS
ncbi:aminotransferase class IV [Neptuniibacter sp.]|uniref:aminotransferase class IV n=1 Tax=Neptuniibacter sp. TaxID=1962643 RepID=UPI0026397C98|nr:aminotransferase class IV [Neptuniibacter sp.]MCP4597060.1 branched-chain amino acid aminotransferase [Neptuniibacter sp.]